MREKKCLAMWYQVTVQPKLLIMPWMSAHLSSYILGCVKELSIITRKERTRHKTIMKDNSWIFHMCAYFCQIILTSTCVGPMGYYLCQVDCGEKENSKFQKTLNKMAAPYEAHWCGVMALFRKDTKERSKCWVAGISLSFTAKYRWYELVIQTLLCIY